MSVDNRRFVRLETFLEVVHRKKTQPTAATLTLTKNISQGGVCLIDCDEIDNFNVADLINLSIFFPYDLNPINTKGKVSWKKDHNIVDQVKKAKFDIGLEFIELKDEDKKRIEQYLKVKFSEKL